MAITGRMIFVIRTVAAALLLVLLAPTTSQADPGKPVHKVKGIHVTLPSGQPLQDDGLVPDGTRNFTYHGASYRVGRDGYVELIKPAPTTPGLLPQLVAPKSQGPNRVSSPGTGYDLQHAIESQNVDPYGYAQPYMPPQPQAPPKKAGKAAAAGQPQQQTGYYVTPSAAYPPQYAQPQAPAQPYYPQQPYYGQPAAYPPQYAQPPQYAMPQYGQPQYAQPAAPSPTGSASGINDNNYPAYGTPVGNGTAVPGYYYPTASYPYPTAVPSVRR
jgi:hypothetical protein